MSEALFRQVVRQYHPYVKKYLPGKNIHYAAAWGNAYEESGGFSNMVERPGSRSGGINGWQWTGFIPPIDRRAKFEAFCKERGLSPLDIHAGIAYFVEETLTLEKSAWEHVLRTTELFAATETFMLLWERPAIQGGRENNYGTARLDIRFKGAQIALAEIEALEGKTQMTDQSGNTIPVPVDVLHAAQQTRTAQLDTLQSIEQHLAQISGHIPQVLQGLQMLSGLSHTPGISLIPGIGPLIAGLGSALPIITAVLSVAGEVVPDLVKIVDKVNGALQQAKQ